MSERHVVRITPENSFKLTGKSIPPVIPKCYISVGIYCRVSSGRQGQLHSLANQISYFVGAIRDDFRYRLYDIYIDVATGSNADRDGDQRMIADAKAGKLDRVFIKSISRMGRDTEEVVKCIRELQSHKVSIYFDMENLEIATKEEIATGKAEDKEFIVTILSGVAAEENKSRSENISMGIKSGIESGKSKLIRRRCYGYKNDADGFLEVVPKQAYIVQNIYRMYMQGASIQKIQRQLQMDEIPSPTGKEKWALRTINEILSNEKYVGNVRLLKTMNKAGIGSGRVKKRGEKSGYLLLTCHPPIISQELYDAVQEEKARRTNIERNEDGTHSRKRGYKYSSKAHEGGDSQ